MNIKWFFSGNRVQQKVQVTFSLYYWMCRQKWKIAKNQVRKSIKKAIFKEPKRKIEFERFAQRPPV